MILKAFRTRTLAVAAVGALTLTATALAAHPNAGKKYGGPTSAAKFNGFRSQVTFKVSSNGKQLRNFTYQSIGCPAGGYGGLKPGVNYLTKAWNEHKLGTITVAGNGSFSKHHVITTYTASGVKTTTISTVSGTFKNAKTATGTIYFSQSVSGKGAPPLKPCGRIKLTFTATQAKASGGGGGYGGY